MNECSSIPADTADCATTGFVSGRERRPAGACGRLRAVCRRRAQRVLYWGRVGGGRAGVSCLPAAPGAPLETAEHQPSALFRAWCAPLFSEEGALPACGRGRHRQLILPFLLCLDTPKVLSASCKRSPVTPSSPRVAPLLFPWPFPCLLACLCVCACHLHLHLVLWHPHLPVPLSSQPTPFLPLP